MGKPITEYPDKPIEGEVVEEQPTRALATWTPKFIESIETMTARRDQNLEYMRKVLKKDVHYGVIPGTGSKPTLLKPGAQALCRDLGLHPEPVIVEHESDVVGKDHAGEPFLSYNIRTDLYALNRETGERMWVGAGFGSCNSWEERYRWRTSQRVCPACGKTAIIKGNPKYAPYEQGNSGPRRTDFAQGGWLCWKKKDGCGAIFQDADPQITGQEIGRVPNDRVMDLDNTIFKQAAKRSLVEAVLNVTGASDVFTQDVEESTERDERHEAPPPPEDAAAVDLAKRVAAAPRPSRAASDDARDLADGAAPTNAKPAAPAIPPMSDQDHRDIAAAFRWYQEASIKGLDPAKALAGKVIVAWGEWMKTNGTGGKWSQLWLRSDLVAKARELLGIAHLDPPTSAEPKLGFDPDEVPA